VDGIFHVVRAFSDDDVTHVEGDVNPIRDLEIIHEELRLKDEEFLGKHLDGLEGAAKRAGKNMDKNKVAELDCVRKVYAMVKDDKRDVRLGDWSNREIEVLNGLNLLTAKPVVYLVNMSEKDYVRKKNKWLAKIKAWIDEKAAAKTDDPNDLYSKPPLIPFSCKMESFLASTQDKEEQEKYLKKLQETYGEEKSGEVKTALSKIITTGYQALQLIYFFTAGPDEVRAWTVRRGTKAPQAAGTIHTDFERGFIMAETMKFVDLKELKTENAVKAAGKYYQKGKEYTVEDGDIFLFKFNVTSTGAKKK
jgi:obg-like ATPase 1